MSKTRTTFTPMRIQGHGWTVFWVHGEGSNRKFERAPGFENIDNYTLAQAQVAADNARRDYVRHEVQS